MNGILTCAEKMALKRKFRSALSLGLITSSDSSPHPKDFQHLARIVRKSVRFTPLVGKSVTAGSKRLTETAAALKFVTLDC